ncbi:MAG: hypothetical protein P1V35_17060 [Planctomycetota bacterium]|nr:hypothetical protein [Planctomycetota bacterium]
MMQHFIKSLCWIVFAATTATAQNQVGFNVAIQGDFQLTAPSPSYGAGTGQVGHWNRMEAPGFSTWFPWSSGPLVDVNNNPTTASIEAWGTSSIVSTGAGMPNPASDDSLLLGVSLALAQNGSAYFAIHDLPPGPYTLVTYTVGLLTSTGVLVLGDYQTTALTGWNSATGFEAGTTHTVHRFYAAPGHPVLIQADALDGWGPWGSVNGFQIIPRPLVTHTSYCDSADNSTGAMASMNFEGRTSLIADTFRAGVSNLPPNQFGYFLVSQTQGTGIMPPGSQGTLCVGGSIGRFNRPGEVQFSGTSGSVLMDIDLSNIPQPNGPTAILPGETWNWQFWYRDNNPTSTSNLSDGNSVTFVP